MSIDSSRYKPECYTIGFVVGAIVSGLLAWWFMHQKMEAEARREKIQNAKWSLEEAMSTYAKIRNGEAAKVSEEKVGIMMVAALALKEMHEEGENILAEENDDMIFRAMGKFIEENRNLLLDYLSQAKSLSPDQKEQIEEAFVLIEKLGERTTKSEGGQ